MKRRSHDAIKGLILQANGLVQLYIFSYYQAQVDQVDGHNSLGYILFLKKKTIKEYTELPIRTPNEHNHT